MLINNNNDNNDICKHVKFISYNGKYPNLCSGTLVLEIDGKKYKFGHDCLSLHYNVKNNKYYYSGEENDSHFESFWISGGETDGRKREWEIMVNGIPKQFRKYASEIDRVFNDNVPHGCCGGCA